MWMCTAPAPAPQEERMVTTTCPCRFVMKRVGCIFLTPAGGRLSSSAMICVRVVISQLLVQESNSILPESGGVVNTSFNPQLSSPHPLRPLNHVGNLPKRESSIIQLRQIYHAPLHPLHYPIDIHVVQRYLQPLTH